MVIYIVFICIVMFTIPISCKAALQKMLRFYIIFRSRLLVVIMTEMYSKNNSVSYKLHVIKQTVNTINCNDYIAIKRCCSKVFKKVIL